MLYSILTFVSSFIFPVRNRILSEMKERIEEIMQLIGTNPSQFAKIIGIKQASLSHILTGRNKPSLDVVMKINQAFPYLNLDWLLYGKGEIGSTEYQTSESETPADGDENADTTEDSMELNARYAADTFQGKDTRTCQQAVERPPRRVIEIRIFYDDGTYETMYPTK